ncbi:phenylalanine--tRNA ligase subunit beta [Phaeodactylibacter xiamenensis]|uniref:phenylalanine--tRNA ligase subunit beta n=1 Tax=Phaeodactylibacter xiamenensis TaxID=1524460 RepID=UPI0024A803E5|nr:phenylalanine--tRNA ligase subunit beta [Phaeodactylibacter xiamenensis]
MKVSLNWLKEYIDIDHSPEEVSAMLTGIGLEEEGMERVESIRGGLEGVVVGHVLECGQHPDADRLSLTKVDVGGEAPLQIVCGAPNVAQGQKVMVATVGTTLYPVGSEEPLTLKKGKIRGQVSEGMICAEDELGTGTSHDGILVLPEDTAVGTPAREYFNIEIDHVYEIGLTPNRSDATNHLGVAKDLAAYLKVNHSHNDGVHLPSVDGFKADDQSLPVSIEVEDAEACPRYAGLTLKGITVKESPNWLKNRLLSIGLRPINNVVDVTNFVLHELGQPLHAFDLAKVKGNKIVVKALPKGTKFTTLDETERELTGEDLMICNGAGEGMCIAGVFGGIGSGVTENTTDVFLESAHFNAKWVRRTSMGHNLRTDAAKVFEKGSDPNIVVYALKRAALLIKELAGGTLSSDITDLYPNPVKPVEVKVSYAHTNRLIGIDIPKAKIHSILEALEMKILADDGETFTVAVPTNKSDVTREADVIEEILRIYGYNEVPIPEQVKTGLNIAPQPDPNLLRDKIGDYLAANGFNEMMALSLSRSQYYKEIFEGLADNKLVYINNTSTVQLDIMRPDMLFSGLEAILHNQNRQQSRLKLFEFGRTYQHGENKIDEQQHLSLFMTGERHPETWLGVREGDADYYALKAFVENILARFGLQGYQETALRDNSLAFGLEYHRGPQTLVRFGKVNPKLVKAMDIRGEVFYADFSWDNLMKARKKYKLSYEELNKFPSSRRDLALVIDNSVKFSDIVAIARKVGKKLIKDINLFDVYENEEQLGAGKKSYAVSFTFENPEKTLKDKEVDKVVNKLIADYESKLGATIRQ